MFRSTSQEFWRRLRRDPACRPAGKKHSLSYVTEEQRKYTSKEPEDIERLLFNRYLRIIKSFYEDACSFYYGQAFLFLTRIYTF